MKSFRHYIEESITPPSWHQSIRDNAFNLTPDAHKSANFYLKMVYKTARSPKMYADSLDALHNFLTDQGVDPTHPHMREIANISTDAEEMYWRKERERRFS
jgi:hypothetical protein